MAGKQAINICWIRRDLRLHDHHALDEALQGGKPVLLLFVFDKNILSRLSAKKDKRLSLIHQTLTKLNKELLKNDSSIYCIYESPLNAFRMLLVKFDVTKVFTNHDYEPYAIARDEEIKQFLYENGVGFATFKDQVIFEKSEIMKADDTPYTVFTPYSRRWKAQFAQLADQQFCSQDKLSQLLRTGSHTIPSLDSMGFEEVHFDLPSLQLSSALLKGYAETRNLPAEAGTSQVSAYLRFGLVSIRGLVYHARQYSETWLNELIWREFFMMILYHFPQVVDHSFKPKYDRTPWRNNEEEFHRWCHGKTGYPIIDAGMRQLNETGWMHNRVRMIVAGFLVKHLLIDWRWGEAYFAEKLLDYELSSNNGNWQWAASSGCDAAPYFRIFNPWTQAKKFDPEEKYVKRWVREYPGDYQTPMVDHDFARKRALQAYQQVLQP